MCKWDKIKPTTTVKNCLILTDHYKTECGNTVKLSYPVDQYGFLYCPFCKQDIEVHNEQI